MLHEVVGLQDTSSNITVHLFSATTPPHHQQDAFIGALKLFFGVWDVHDVFLFSPKIPAVLN